MNRPIESKYESTCKTCFSEVELGDLIIHELWGWVHWLCQGGHKPQCDAITYVGLPCQMPPKFGALCRVHYQMQELGKVFPRGAVELVYG